MILLKNSADAPLSPLARGGSQSAAPPDADCGSPWAGDVPPRAISQQSHGNLGYLLIHTWDWCGKGWWVSTLRCSFVRHV